MTPEQITATIENETKSIFIIPPKKRFTKISRDLHKLMITGCKDCSASAYQTYSYCISMHPDSIITPSKVAEEFKKISKITGGKPKSFNTVRQQFAQLEKVGLVYREHIRDKDGKFLGGIWRFFSLRPDDKKTSKDDSEDKDQELKENSVGNDDEACDEKMSTVSYNKERARVCKINRKINCSSSAAKNERRYTTTTTLPKKIENARTDGPPISKELVSDALKFGEDYVLEAIKYSREKNPSNPGCVFRGASETKYDSIVVRLKGALKRIPVDVPNNANQSQINCIKCYNSNCEKEEPTCPSFKSVNGKKKQPTGLCLQYCPLIKKYQ